MRIFHKLSTLAKNPFAHSSTILIENYAYHRPEKIYHSIIKKITKNDKIFKKALDIGCGPGNSTFALRKFADEIYGIDPYKLMLDFANIIKEKNVKDNEKIHFLRGYAEELDQLFKPRTFDLITMANTFRLVNPEKSISQISNVLADSGLFVLYYYTLHGLEKDNDFNDWLNFQFFKQYPIVSQDKKFTPQLKLLANDFEYFSQENYDEIILMDRNALLGLIMSTSGIFNAVSTNNRNLEDIKSELKCQLNSLLDEKAKFPFVFKVSILRWIRKPRLRLENGDTDIKMNYRL